MNRTTLNAVRLAIGLLILFFTASGALAAPEGLFGLDLPEHAVPDRVSVVRRLEANRKETYANFDGPGCIRHIYLTLSKPIAPNALPMMNRKILIRIFF